MYFISLIIIKGANVEVKNNDGFTVLIVASYYGFKEIVELLLSLRYNSKIDIEAKNNQGNHYFFCSSYIYIYIYIFYHCV